MSERRPRYESEDSLSERVWRDVADALRASGAAALPASREVARPGLLDSFADEMRGYYDSLLARGFTAEQALQLVCQFQAICLVLRVGRGASQYEDVWEPPT